MKYILTLALSAETRRIIKGCIIAGFVLILLGYLVVWLDWQPEPEWAGIREFGGRP